MMSSERSSGALVPDGVRKQMFSWLVKKHHGSCELSKVIRELLPWLKSKEDLLKILNDAPWHSQCVMLLHSVDGDDTLAMAYCQKLRLCFNYYKEGSCGRSSCLFIHLCHFKLFYNQCRCSETDNCMEQEQNLDNIKVLHSLSDEEKGIVLRNSLPTVCLGYNSPQGCLNILRYGMCPYVHICISHIHGKCRDPDCLWAHSLKDAPHHEQLQYWNETIESNKGLEMKLIGSLLVPPVAGPLLKFLINRGNQGASLEETDRVVGIKGLGKDILTASGEPEVVVYTQPVDGKLYAAISAAEFLICMGYNSPSGCNSDDCLSFHMCARFIQGNCFSSRSCAFSHDLDDDDNATCFMKKKCSNLGLEDRRQVIQMSMLRLCMNDHCTDELCGGLHLCVDYISGVCCRLDCSKGHSFQSEHNRNTLIMHDMAEWGEGVLKKRLVCHERWSREEESLSLKESVKKPELSRLLSVFDELQISSTGAAVCATKKEIDTNHNELEDSDGEQTSDPVITQHGDGALSLKTVTQEKISPAQTESKASAVMDYCWCVEENGEYIAFGAVEDGLQQDLIEARFQEFQKNKNFGVLNYEENGSHFELNFNFMFRLNLNTSTRTSILREPKRRAASSYRVSYQQLVLPAVIPPWSPMDTRRPFEADMVALSPISEECLKVEREFLRSMNQPIFRIHRIYRVQNMNLYRRYMLMKAEITQQLAEQPRELSLFHGTPDMDTVRCICNQSFDWRLSGQYGSKYGDGAYFATRAFFSSHYTRPSLENKRRFMFQAKVLVGKHSQGYAGMKRPPPMGSKRHGLLYNSVVDNKAMPQTYVIFNSDQAYPTYLIEYIDITAFSA